MGRVKEVKGNVGGANEEVGCFVILEKAPVVRKWN